MSIWEKKKERAHIGTGTMEMDMIINGTREKQI